MSVRRLAEDAVQPGVFGFNRENTAWAKATIKKYPQGREQSAVIPLMMRAQEQDGWVTRAAIEAIADMLAMPYIRALEVATFYTQFQLKPVGTKAHVQVCGTTPCMLRGSEELIKVCKRKIGAEQFITNENGTLSWEEVECQGACVNAPMMMIFKDAYEDLTPEQLADIIDEFEAGKGDQVKPGPQNGRHLSAPIGGLTTLTEADAPVKAKPARKAPAKAAVPTAKKPATSATKSAVATSDKNRPAGMDKPAEIDDLNLIPALARKLKGFSTRLVVYKWEQVSKWKKAEREWVDGFLKFNGRIDREDWVKQANALAKGGIDEYVRVFGKKPR